MPYLSLEEAHALGGMGDSLHIGPQVGLPADRGTPIIQRGPHGRRFAPLPSRDEKGVRFWRESEGPVGMPWLPMPRVTSVMGMGAPPLKITDEYKHEWTTRVSNLEKLVASPPASMSLPALRSLVEGHKQELGQVNLAERWSGSWVPRLVGGFASWQELWDRLTDLRATVAFKEGRLSESSLTSRSPAAAAAVDFATTVTNPLSLASVNYDYYGRPIVKAVKSAADAAEEAVKKKLEEQRRSIVITVAVVAGIGVVALMAYGAGSGVGSGIGARIAGLGKNNPRRKRPRRGRR